jgi:hypothetical protein
MTWASFWSWLILRRSVQKTNDPEESHTNVVGFQKNLK